MGWSRSPLVETAARVSVYVFVSMLLSPVCRCHVYPGPSSSCIHVHPAVCKPVLSHRVSVRFLPRRLLGRPLATLVHVTSDPELACSWLELTSRQSPVSRDVWKHEQDFLCPGGRCVSLHVFHHWPGYLCQSQHGCPGRVWMWVVCKWGKGVRVCKWASWTPTICETPLGWAGVSPCSVWEWGQKR